MALRRAVENPSLDDNCLSNLMDYGKQMRMLMPHRSTDGGGVLMDLAQRDFFCRQAAEDDLPEIATIYATCVRNGDGAYDDRVDPAEITERYRGLLARKMPFLVAAIPGRLVGFAHGEAYHPGNGFTHCIHSSVWVCAAHRQTGIGAALLGGLLMTCRQARYRQVMSWVLLDNEAGLALHRRLGFVVMGWHREACFTGGRLRDVMMLRHDLWQHGELPAHSFADHLPVRSAVGQMLTHA